jgi:biopolymer transport protein ExbD
MAGTAQSSDEPIVNINVTPLVDVTLVLLIIFMVTTKMIVSQAVPLDLPEGKTGHEMQSVFSIVLVKDGRIQVNGRDLANDDAVFQAAKEQRQKDPELRAVIKADREVTHGRVIKVLDLLKQADVRKIAFGVSPPVVGPKSQ